MKKYVVTVLIKNKTTSYKITANDHSDAFEKIEAKLKKEKKTWDEISAHPEDWEPSEAIKELMRNKII